MSIQETHPIPLTLTEDMAKNLQAALGTSIFPPPTLPFLFWSMVEVPWLAGAGPIIHGEQRFTYLQPLEIGQSYTVVVKLKALKQKGSKQFLYHDLEVRRGDLLAAICSSTFIITKENER